MRGKLTKDELLNKDFKPFEPNYLDSPSCDGCYQKLYRDNLGNKKYFLDVKHYSMTHPTTREDLSGFEISTQVYKNGNHEAINITFLNDNIDDAEEFINKLFEYNLIENYENI